VKSADAIYAKYVTPYMNNFRVFLTHRLVSKETKSLFSKTEELHSAKPERDIKESQKMLEAISKALHALPVMRTPTLHLNLMKENSSDHDAEADLYVPFYINRNISYSYPTDLISRNV